MGFTSKDLKPLEKKADTNVDINSQSKAAKKAWGWMQKWFGYVAVVIASIVYLFWGWFDFYDKDTTVWIIIASSSIILAFGFMINKFFRLQALIDMAQAEPITDAEKEHEQTIAQAEEIYEYADDWTTVENKAAIRNARMYIMASGGLSYSKYFTESGDFIGDKLIPSVNKSDAKALQKRTQDIIDTINKARYFKITPLTITDLTSTESVNLDPHKFGRDKATFQRMESAKDAVTKVLIALVFGYFGVKMIDSPSWNTLMETAIQVVLFYLIGAVTYYTTTAYMMGEYRSSIIKKTRYLRKFIHWVANNLDTLKEVKENVNNGENTTTTSGGTQELVSSKPSTDDPRGSTVSSTTTPSVTGADEEAGSWI